MSNSGVLVTDVNVSQEERSLVDKDFLTPSAFCDAYHPQVRAMAHHLTRDCTSDSERVAALLRWVRNQIAHRTMPYPQAASDTLLSQTGSCTNRANLLVAMLRALGIPAGFHLLKMEAKDSYGLLGSPVFHPFPDDSFHMFCAVMLGEEWIKCDPTKWHLLLENNLADAR